MSPRVELSPGGFDTSESSLIALVLSMGVISTLVLSVLRRNWAELLLFLNSKYSVFRSIAISSLYFTMI